MDFLTNLNLNKNELQNVVIQNLAQAPDTPKEGQIYYNTTDKLLYQYNGDAGWKPIGAPYKLPVASADTLGGIKVGAGLAITGDGILSATGGGIADSVAWENVTGRPFDKFGTEFQVDGSVGDQTVNIKEVPQNKVTGLTDALNSKISGVKVNGVTVLPQSGVVDVKVPTKTSELNNDSGFINSSGAPVQSVNGRQGVVVLTAADVSALPTTGGGLTGELAMNNHKITGVAQGIADTDAVNKKQMEDAIKAIGTVFNFKGSKPSVSDLPSTGNTVGDVWYVENESVGYIWIKDSGSEGRWEQLGPSIGLSGYLTKAGLAQATGQATDNAMSQKATTDALANKADKSAVQAIPVVKVAQETMSPSLSTVTVNYQGTVLNTYVKDASGEEVMLDVTISAGNVVFTASTAPSSNLTCVVIYM